MTSKSRTVAIVYLLFACVVYCRVCDGAIHYSCKGRLVWTLYSEDGTPEPMKTWSFRVCVSNTIWSAETIAIEGLDIGGKQFIYHDGTNLYQLHLYGDQKESNTKYNVIRAQLRAKSGMTNLVATNKVFDSSAVFSPEKVPLYDSRGIAPLWLALCSTEYLNSESRKRIQPVFEMGSTRSARYPIEGFIGYLDAKKQLPKMIVFWNEGYNYDTDRPPSQGNLVLRRETPPYNKGYTNAIYHVLETTNSGPLILPQHFTLTRFMPKKGASKSSEIIKGWKYEAFVEQVEAISGTPRLEPSSPITRTYVIDQRIKTQFPTIPDARYVATNGQWLPQGSLPNIPAIKRQVQVAATYNTNASRAILIVLVAFLGFPALAIWHKSRSRDNANKKTKKE